MKEQLSELKNESDKVIEAIVSGMDFKTKDPREIIFSAVSSVRLADRIIKELFLDYGLEGEEDVVRRLLANVLLQKTFKHKN